MVTVKCLSCDAENDPRSTGGYCDACGKKLPASAAFRSKRAVMGDTGSGSVADAEPTPGPRRETSATLFTVAVLRLIAGGLFLVVGPVFLRDVPDAFLPTVLLGTVIETGFYVLLGLGARVMPRTSALMGLVIFLLAGAVTFAVFASGKSAEPGFKGAPLGLLWLAFLVKAVIQSFRSPARRASAAV